MSFSDLISCWFELLCSCFFCLTMLVWHTHSFTSNQPWKQKDWDDFSAFLLQWELSENIASDTKSLQKIELGFGDKQLNKSKTHIWLLYYSIFMSLSSMEEAIEHFWLVVGSVLCLNLRSLLYTHFWFLALVMPVHTKLLSCHAFYNFLLTARTCVCIACSCIWF